MHRAKVVLRADNDAPRGSEWNPMTDDEVRQKFSRLAAPLLSDARIGAYLQALRRHCSERQVDWLLGEFNE